MQEQKILNFLNNYITVSFSITHSELNLGPISLPIQKAFKPDGRYRVKMTTLIIKISYRRRLVR